MEKYGIVYKMMQKGDIVGFFLVDSNNKQTLVRKEQVIKMAERGQIADWEVTVDEDGEKHLYSRHRSLRDLPNSIKSPLQIVEILGRIIKNGEDVGYICLDSNGNRRNLSKDKMWNLSSMGYVSGITVANRGGCRVLISEGQVLTNIPVYEQKVTSVQE